MNKNHIFLGLALIAAAGFAGCNYSTSTNDSSSKEISTPAGAAPEVPAMADAVSTPETTKSDDAGSTAATDTGTQTQGDSGAADDSGNSGADAPQDPVVCYISIRTQAKHCYTQHTDPDGTIHECEIDDPTQCHIVPAQPGSGGLVRGPLGSGSEGSDGGDDSDGGVHLVRRPL